MFRLFRFAFLPSPSPRPRSLPACWAAHLRHIMPIQRRSIYAILCPFKGGTFTPYYTHSKAVHLRHIMPIQRRSIYAILCPFKGGTFTPYYAHSKAVHLRRTMHIQIHVHRNIQFADWTLSVAALGKKKKLHAWSSRTLKKVLRTLIFRSALGQRLQSFQPMAL